MSKIAVFGMGYVGTVTAACLSRDGHQVIGVDVDRGKVDAVNNGRSPVVEHGLDELVAQQVGSGSLTATVDGQAAVEQSDIALVTVGTPSARSGAVSSRAVEKVVQSIGESLQGSTRDYIVVVRSTLLPGILEDTLAPILAEASGRELGANLRICNNPEFLRESTALKDYDQPPMIVFGTTDGWDAQGALELYHGIPVEPVVTDSRTAALLKYACNAYHALKIAFANEIGGVARSLGADGRRVMDLVCRDTKLNVSAAYLRPGFAFGGSCLPKDLRALTRHAEEEALRTCLLASILPSNDEHLRRAVEMIEESGHKKIGIVGLAFKAGTDDLRESPYVTLVETLVGRGYEVAIYDPSVAVSRLRGRNLAYIDQHLPHLAALLVPNATDLYDHASLMVVCTSVADDLQLEASFAGETIDLRSCLVTAPLQEAESLVSSGQA